MCVIVIVYQHTILYIQLTHTKTHIHLAVVALSLSLSLPLYLWFTSGFFCRNENPKGFENHAHKFPHVLILLVFFGRFASMCALFFSSRLEISYANHLERIWLFVLDLHPLLRFDW